MTYLNSYSTYINVFIHGILVLLVLCLFMEFQFYQDYLIRVAFCGYQIQKKLKLMSMS